MDFIQKKISPSDKNVKLLYHDQTVEQVDLIIEEYLNRINLETIIMPKIINKIILSDSITYTQIYVSGITVKEFLIRTDSVSLFLSVATVLLKEIVKLHKKDKGVLLDLNLCNYIISSGNIYLVDFLPPIVIEKTLCADKHNYLTRLFCEYGYGVVGFVYYILKGIVLNRSTCTCDKKILAKCFLAELENNLDISIVNLFDLDDSFFPFNYYLKHIRQFFITPNLKTYKVVANDSFRAALNAESNKNAM